MTADLSLRIDGLECWRVTLTFRVVDGVLAEPKILALSEAPTPYALGEDSVIELKDGGDWRKVSLTYLMALLRARPTIKI
jgi:hypothetical protein